MRIKQTGDAWEEGFRVIATKRRLLYCRLGKASLSTDRNMHSIALSLSGLLSISFSDICGTCKSNV